MGTICCRLLRMRRSRGKYEIAVVESLDGAVGGGDRRQGVELVAGLDGAVGWRRSSPPFTPAPPYLEWELLPIFLGGAWGGVV
jgi:hypothetical protein